MRSLAFAVAYWLISIVYAVVATVMMLAPGRGAVTWAVRRYSQRMIWALRVFAGVRIELRGQENLPDGAFILAAKHHSWGDGFVMFANIENLAFVTGDHLERIPLLRGILRKLGAIVVDSCGGPEARKALAQSAAKAHREGRRILIYPEGHLARAGEHFRYRSGVFYMHRDFGLPVVPVATNLGLRWPQQDFRKTPGVATIEFLPPIPMGLSRGPFLKLLEERIETRTQELIAMATGEPAQPSVLAPTPGEDPKGA